MERLDLALANGPRGHRTLREITPHIGRAASLILFLLAFVLSFTEAVAES
jgi:hypothetical protein